MSKTKYTAPANAKSKFKNDFKDEGGFENQSVEELQHYAAHKSQETTNSVNDCLKIAEMIKDDASNTLNMLHEQGEQIARTHETAVTIEKDLSKGEKLLGSLGGIFSVPWKPKKNKQIKGPSTSSEDMKEAKKGDREKLGLDKKQKNRQYAEATTAMEQVEIEKQKQDDGLSDLSDVLGQLKDMAVDMGTEMDKQNKALDALHDDVDELNSRVKGANQRARKLVGK